MRALKSELVRQPSRKARAASPKPRKAIEPELMVESGMGSLSRIIAPRNRRAPNYRGRQRANWQVAFRARRTGRLRPGRPRLVSITSELDRCELGRICHK